MNREQLEALGTPEIVIEMFLSLQSTVAEQALKIAELEAKLAMNSSNSSMPPSSDKFKTKSLRKKSGKKPGGQKGHRGSNLEITAEPDETVELRPEKCANCGTDLSKINGAHTDDFRYKIDTRIITKVTRYEQVEIICPVCGAANKGEFPCGINSHIQYGENVRTVSVILNAHAMVSNDKTAKIMRDMMGIPISAGTIVNHVKNFVESAKPVTDEIPKVLINSSLGNFDETGSSVNGKKIWIHNSSNSEATWVTVHSKRGKDGSDANGVLPEFSGIAVHDRWSPYFKYTNCVHALCNAHLLRDLQGIIDAFDHKWAKQMQVLLREMCHVVKKYKVADKSKLSAYYSCKFAAEYDKIITLGNLETPHNPNSKKQTKSHNTLLAFMTYREEICRFTQDFRVPFDNNQAERDIRNVKVKHKVSGGFRSLNGAENFAAVSSVIGTAVKQGLSVFQTISGIFSGSVSSLFHKHT